MHAPNFEAAVARIELADSAIDAINRYSKLDLPVPPT
jgi:hypothetical protein